MMMLRWFSTFLLSWLLSCAAHAGTKVIDVELGVSTLDTPHMEFVPEVRYMTTGFPRAWVDGVKSQETQQRQQEKSKF